jgi:hypothetical protein
MINAGVNLGGAIANAFSMWDNLEQPAPDKVRRMRYSPIGYNYISPDQEVKNIRTSVNTANRRALELGMPEQLSTNLANQLNATENVYDKTNKANLSMISNVNALNSRGDIESQSRNMAADQFDIQMKMKDDAMRSAAYNTNMNNLWGYTNNIATNYGQTNENMFKADIYKYLYDNGYLQNMFN